MCSGASHAADEASLRLSNRPAPAVRLTFTVFLSTPYGVYYFMCSVHRLLLSAYYCTLLSLYTCSSLCSYDVMMRDLSLSYHRISHILLTYLLTYSTYLLTFLYLLV